MIVKDEEKNIKRCLNSLSDLADEIIILDTGSKDKTKEIAKEYTDKVYDFEWIEDFSAARNASFQFASGDYVMWLDADDVIDEKNLKKLKKLKESCDKSTDVYMLKYATTFDENGNATFEYYRERILKRSRNFRWQGRVHEVIAPSGKISYEDISIFHKKERTAYTDRNLRIYKKQIEKEGELSGRAQYYYARELYYNGLTKECIDEMNKFLNSEEGWIENKIEAWSMLAKCHLKRGNKEEAYKALYQSFLYDLPRAEICCEIADMMFFEKRIIECVYWYELALKCKRENRKSGFIINECYDMTPLLQLCLCYYKLGDIKRAEEYNKRAEKIKPSDRRVVYNKEFFAKIKK